LREHTAYTYPTSVGEWLAHAVQLAGGAIWQAPFIPLLLGPTVAETARTGFAMHGRQAAGNREIVNSGLSSSGPLSCRSRRREGPIPREVNRTRPLLLQSSLVLVNTLIIQQILSEPQWAGRLTNRDKKAITALIWAHINPYGTFHIDMNTRLDLGPAGQHAEAA